MNKLINFILLFFTFITFFGCSEEIIKNELNLDNISSNSTSNIINITSFGTSPSFHNDNLSQRKLATRMSDEFTNAIEIESSESVILPHLHRYIYPGSLLRGNSIQDLGYIPIAANLNPVTVSLSIPSTRYKTGFTMERPSLSSLRNLVNSYLKSSDFSQHGQFSYSIEEFSSYDELKVAFGSNVNTRNLFGKRSTSDNKYGHLIAKKTGLYIKFYQTSFTLDMDIPNRSLVKDYNFDNGGVDPVYVSSISYGRMGILTLETDEKSEEAIRNINTSFSKLFIKGNSNLTEQEKKFISSARFQIYLLGGNGITAVQSFEGYEAFVKHISQGSFTRENPGIPIFCSYSNLKDNSPVKTKFKFDIKKRPLYVEYKIENLKEERYRNGRIKSREGDLKLYFYESRSKIPVIASPYITIKLNKTIHSIRRNVNSNSIIHNINEESIIPIQNTLMRTFYDFGKVILYNSSPNPRNQFLQFEKNESYQILPDEKYNYIPLN